MRFLFVLVGVALISASWAVWRTWDWEGLVLNLATELIGAVATYLLLERLVGGQEEEEEERRRLIAELGSSVKDVAIAAAEKLYQRGWLELPEANLMGADLQEASLLAANLHGAYLTGANLHGTDLLYANLQEAHLRGANLQGADLRGANLQETDLRAVKFDENTVLPDKTKWSPDTDMARFTDPKHPDFWRSGYRTSPAYRGDA
jgi:uncharacterized protein YjbI with pentapeptide repeats